MICNACNRNCRCPYRETQDSVMVRFTAEELLDLMSAAQTGEARREVIQRLETALRLVAP